MKRVGHDSATKQQQQKVSLKLDQFTPNTRLLRKGSSPCCKHQSLGQRMTSSAVFPPLFMAQFQFWWGATGCMGTSSSITNHASDRSVGSDRGTWGLKVIVEFRWCLPTSAWSWVPEVTVEGQAHGMWQSQNAVLLTNSVIHSCIHRQWVESFHGLSAGLKSRSVPVSTRNSESSWSNHSLATWPQKSCISSPDLNFLISRMGLFWLLHQGHSWLFWGPAPLWSAVKVSGSLLELVGEGQGFGTRKTSTLLLVLPCACCAVRCPVQLLCFLFPAYLMWLWHFCRRALWEWGETMIKRTWLSANVMPISFLSGCWLSCALLLLEHDLHPLLPMLIRSPGSGRGRQTASLGAQGNKHLPLVVIGEVVPAQEEAGPGCKARSPGFCLEPATRSHCVSISRSPSSLNLIVFTEPSLPDPLASPCPDKPVGLWCACWIASIMEHHSGLWGFHQLLPAWAPQELIVWRSQQTDSGQGRDCGF